jgi:hypothetical protein
MKKSYDAQPVLRRHLFPCGKKIHEEWAKVQGPTTTHSFILSLVQDDTLMISTHTKMSVFSSPAVQSVAKYSLAAGITGLSVGGFFKLLRHVSGTSTEQALQSLEPFLQPEERQTLLQDSKMLDLMDRMAMYQSMAPEDFSQLLKASIDLVKATHE